MAGKAMQFNEVWTVAHSEVRKRLTVVDGCGYGHCKLFRYMVRCVMQRRPGGPVLLLLGILSVNMSCALCCLNATDRLHYY